MSEDLQRRHRYCRPFWSFECGVVCTHAMIVRPALYLPLRSQKPPRPKAVPPHDVDSALFPARKLLRVGTAVPTLPLLDVGLPGVQYSTRPRRTQRRPTQPTGVRLLAGCVHDAKARRSAARSPRFEGLDRRVRLV